MKQEDFVAESEDDDATTKACQNASQRIDDTTSIEDTIDIEKISQSSRIVSNKKLHKNCPAPAQELIPCDSQNESKILHDGKFTQSFQVRKDDGLLEIRSFVMVDSRTWPGINKPGGPGRVAAVRQEDQSFVYDIRYIFGGFEKGVRREFIHLSNLLEREQTARVPQPRQYYHEEYAEPRGVKRSNKEQSKKKRWEPQECNDLMRDDANDMKSPSVTAYIQENEKVRTVERETKPVLPSVSGKSVYTRKRRRLRQNSDRIRGDSGSELEQIDRTVFNDFGKNTSEASNSAESDDGYQPLHLSRRHTFEKKRRRYVGGYWHHGEDADSTFIQPEDSAMDLPDDVRKQTHFKLAESIDGLKHQLAVESENFEMALCQFYSVKRSISFDTSSTLEYSELNDLYDKLTQLESSLRKDIIRSGEDIVDMIIRAIEGRDARLPENLELDHDERKRRVAEYGSWLRKTKMIAEEMYRENRWKKPGVPSELDSGSQSGEALGGEMSDEDYESEDAEADRVLEEWQDGCDAATLDVRDGNYDTSDERIWTSRSQESFTQLPKAHTRARSRISFDHRIQSSGLTVNSGTIPRQIQSKLRLTTRRITSEDFSSKWNWYRVLKNIRTSRKQNSSGKLCSKKQPNKLQKSKSWLFRHDVNAKVRALRNLRSENASNSKLRSIARKHVSPLTNASAPQNAHYIDNESHHSREYADWDSVFEVVQVDSSLSRLLQLAPCTVERQRALLDFEKNVDGELYRMCPAINDPIDHQKAFIAHQGKFTRQSLNLLYWMEQKFMKSVTLELFEKRETYIATDWKNTTTYKELENLEGACKQALLTFTETTIRTLCYQSLETIHKLAEFASTELKQILQCIPSCGQIFENFKGYFAFFELEDEISTPLLHTISCIFWHALRIAEALLKVSACKTQQSESDLNSAQEMPDILRPKCVILAAALYLVDLYLHIPMSHGVHQEEDHRDTLHLKSEMPAQSLWLFIFQCSHDQVDPTESVKASSALMPDSKTFWIMLQMMFEHGLVRQLASDFVARRPFGPYTQDKNNTIPPTLDNDIESLVEAEVLSLKVGWELTTTLACLCFENKDLELTKQNDAEKWGLVKVLLRQSTGIASCILDCKKNECYHQNYAIYISMALQHVLTLSGLWAPCIEVVELICFESKLCFGITAYELPSILSLLEKKTIDFQVAKRNNSPKLAQLTSHWSLEAAASKSHAGSQQAYIDLICSIVLLLKFEKTIQRNRFRQRLIRTISNRLDANSSSGVEINTAGTWDWKKILPSNSTKQPEGQTSDGLESILMLCFLALFAFISIQFDTLENTLTLAQPRDHRQLSRDIEYYCNELTRVEKEKIVQPSLLAGIFAFIGRLVISRTDLLAIVLKHFSIHLECTMKEILQSAWNPATARTTASDQESGKGANLCAPEDVVLLEFTNLAEFFLDHIHGGNLAQVEALPHKYDDALSSCVTAIISPALALAIDACLENRLLHDYLPRILNLLWQLSPARYYQPTLSLKGISLMHCIEKSDTNEQVNDDFEDDDMLELLASVDLEKLSSVKQAKPLEWTLKDLVMAFEADILKALTRPYRLPLQRLLFSSSMLASPVGRQSSLNYQTMQIFGCIISTCSSSYSWDVARAASFQKPCFFTSKLFSAIIRHNWDARNWLVLSFFSDTNAENELLQLWLKATFDPTTLFRDRDSGHINYWEAMTDTIIYNLHQNVRLETKMAPLMFQCMQDTASRFYPTFTSHMTSSVAQPDHCQLHFQLFLSLCKSIGSVWNRSCMEPQNNQRYQFRSKFMDRYHGIFTVYTELYEANLRHMITRLEQMKSSGWMRSTMVLQKEFARQQYTSTNAHCLDTSIDGLDLDSLNGKEQTNEPLWQALRLFKFMYDCAEAFLIHCSDLAIGQQNTFFAIMEVMFRQAVFAENERIKAKFPSKFKAFTTAKSEHTLTAWNSLLESIRTYFAQQKYPSLLRWFARTENSYQTLENGWKSSNLRLLLLNILDYDGALGIRSYYHDLEDDQLVNIATRVRREAYYLSCGLLICNTTSAQAQSLSESSENSLLLTQKLRKFILTNFLAELLADAVAEGGPLGQTLLPCAQFVKAYVHHCKLNLKPAEAVSDLAANPLEALPFISLVAEYTFCKPLDTIVQYETLSYILAIELCGILQYMLETFEWWGRSDRLCEHKQVFNLLHLSLCSIGVILRHVDESSFNEIVDTLIDGGKKEILDLDAIKNRFQKENTRMLAKEYSPIERVNAFDRPKGETPDAYGFSKALICADLLCATRSLIKVCCLTAVQQREIQMAVRLFASLRD